MKVTQELVDDVLMDYFNPFAYITVRNGHSDGGFRIQSTDDTTVKFTIYDKRCESEDKKVIWYKEIDINKYQDVLSLKAGIAVELEEGIYGITNSTHE